HVDSLTEHCELRIGDQGSNLDERVAAQVETGHLAVDPNQVVGHAPLLALLSAHLRVPATLWPAAVPSALLSGVKLALVHPGLRQPWLGRVIDLREALVVLPGQAPVVLVRI